MGIYTNAEGMRICGGGGAVRVSLSSGTGQGNGGTSLPCKGCYIQAALANTDEVYMNIGAAASSSLGIELGRQGIDANQQASCQPLWVPIDDVASLYFYSADADAVVDILYFVGGGS